MNTLLLKIYDIEKDAADIRTAGELLRNGELVAIPTETVYGLAADALNPDAVRKIYIAKGRPSDNPLIVHIARTEELYDLAREVPDTALALANAFWPGPLTVILPKKDCIPDVTSGGLDTVAIRMPSHPAAHAIIEAAGVPLAAPSANISGFPSPTEFRHVQDDLTGRVAALVDGGNSAVGVESTVITLCTNPPRILRPGGITKEQLETVLGTVNIDDAVLHPLQAGQTAASPGMKYRHYSPKADVTVIKGDRASFLKFMKTEADKDDFALCFTEDEPYLSAPCVTFGSETEPLTQTFRLFDALRELDEKGAKTVWSRNPSADGVGLAVCNRLYRSAGFTFRQAPGLLVGLTGQTGAGKSTAALAFAQRGFRIVDADKIARTVTEPGSPVLPMLADAFGADILNGDGTLNRRLLAGRAFQDSTSTETLNRITHPEILRRIREQTSQLCAEGVHTLLDAPLLFDCQLGSMCDYTVTVTAPKEVRLARLCRRDSTDIDDVLRRMDAQKPEEYYTSQSDFVIQNLEINEFSSKINQMITVILNGGYKQ